MPEGHFRGQRTEVRGQRTEDGRQRSEVRGRTADGQAGRRMNEEGSPIIFPSIAPTSWHFSVKPTRSPSDRVSASHAGKIEPGLLFLALFADPRLSTYSRSRASYLRLAHASQQVGYEQIERNAGSGRYSAVLRSSAGKPLLILENFHREVA